MYGKPPPENAHSLKFANLLKFAMQVGLGRNVNAVNTRWTSDSLSNAAGGGFTPDAVKRWIAGNTIPNEQNTKQIIQILTAGEPHAKEWFNHFAETSSEERQRPRKSQVEDDRTQRERFRQGLERIFWETSRFELFLRDKLEKHLRNYSSEGDSRSAAYFRVILAAEAEGWLDALARAAYEAAPHNAQIEAVARERGAIPENQPQRQGKTTAPIRGDRVALVIGNAAYEGANPLQNPRNDAKAVARMLKELKFQLITVDQQIDHNSDLGLINMCRALADFSVAAEGADTAIFYFAGHGLEVDGHNYLLPRDARLDSIRRMYFECIKLVDIRAAVEQANNLRLIILDACRDDPFRVPMRGLEGRRSVSRGFGNIEPTGNTGVAYAAKHGTMASDGSAGGNSPYTTALLKHLPTPDIDVRILFGRIRDEVMLMTGGRQEPHLYSNFGGQQLYLHESKKGSNRLLQSISNNGVETAQNGPITPLQEARAIWEELKIDETDDPELIMAYINQVEDVPIQVYRARQRLMRVEKLLIDREAEDWKTAHALGTALVLEEFLNTWPSGAHAKEAQSHLAEAKKWWAALDIRTVDSVQGYLREYPEGRWANQARQRILDFEKAAPIARS